MRLGAAMNNQTQTVQQELKHNPFNISPKTTLEEALAVVHAKGVSGKNWDAFFTLSAHAEYRQQVFNG
jgi:hypothetical protein